jgi:hypothetical protein
LVGILAGLSFSPLNAQDPPSHKVRFPAGDAAWEVKVAKNKRPSPDAQPAETGRQIKSIIMVRKGKFRRDTTLWSDGTSTEMWWLSEPPLALVQGRSSGDIRGLKISQLGPRRFDESFFDWISAKTYKGEDSFEGKKVKVYQVERTLDDGDVATTSAKLDAETNEPVAWSDGAKTVTFKFGLPVPQEPLVLPEAFRNALVRYEAYYAPAERRGKR